MIIEYKLKKISLYFAIFLMMFFIFSKNLFNSVEKDYFNNFQHDSESLVLGKILSDDLFIDLKSNLGYVYFNNTEINSHSKLSYNLLHKNSFDNFKIEIENINDSNWINGWAFKFDKFVIKNNQSIDYEKWIGYKINFDNTYIKDIQYVGNYVNITLNRSINRETVNKEIILLNELVNKENLSIAKYTSHFGFQGILYSYLYNKIGFSIDALYKINSIILSLIFVILFIQFKKIINLEFAVIFLLTILLSQIFVSFARNLYWITFLWFLPIVVVNYYFLSKTRNIKILLSILFIVAIFLKSLCGYEYLSSIVLLAIVPFIYALFIGNNYYSKKDLMFYIIVFGILSIIGFVLALLFHAYVKGDGLIMDGLKLIYELDVKRRTYGSPDAFGTALYNSLSASPFQVVITYIKNWNIDLLYKINGSFFKILLMISVFTIFYKFFVKHNSLMRDLGLFCTFIIVPISWFILAKSHSYEHTHINFVLWYFGTVAALIYISLNGFKILFYKIIKFFILNDESSF